MVHTRWEIVKRLCPTCMANMMSISLLVSQNVKRHNTLHESYLAPTLKKWGYNKGKLIMMITLKYRYSFDKKNSVTKVNDDNHA